MITPARFVGGGVAADFLRRLQVRTLASLFVALLCPVWMEAEVLLSLAIHSSAYLVSAMACPVWMETRVLQSLAIHSSANLSSVMAKMWIPSGTISRTRTAPLWQMRPTEMLKLSSHSGETYCFVPVSVTMFLQAVATGDNSSRLFLKRKIG